MKKNIIRLTCLLLTVCGFTNCTSNFEKYNTNPYAIYEADPTLLMPTMIDAMMYVQQNDAQMIDDMVGSLGGYFALSNRWGGQNFDTFNPSDGWNAVPYNTMFEDIYANFFEIEKSTNKSGHYYAVAKLVRAAVMMRVADCYGGIPYSQVKDGNFYAAYDTDRDVYKNIIEDLQDAATILFAYSQEFPALRPLGIADMLYAGDYSKWARLANTLALRAAVRSGDKEAAEAICKHAAGLIETNAQNAMMNPGVQGNPYQLHSVSWGDLRVNSSIVDYMNGYEDPRAEKYFQKSGFDKDQYIGLRAGTYPFVKNEVQGYSNPNFKSSDFLPVCVAAETNFLRAEMALRGWAVDGSAESYYKAGIKLSMEQWGADADKVSDYIDNDELKPADHKDPRGAKYNYDRKSEITIKWSEEATFEQKLERIITQKWIANYPMGLEGWAEFRRTGYPELAPATDNLSNGVITDNFRGMRRLRYPFTERTLNPKNYEAAVAAMGGVDNESIDLFWAKKN